MIKVLIVDDSAVVRKILRRSLSIYDDIKVVGTAPDPYIARDMIIELKPDVITLDIEMPKMDGLTFLYKLMQHFPIPVLIISSLTRSSRDMAIKALELGAVDVISKPGSSFSVDRIEEVIVEKIRGASRSLIKRSHIHHNKNVTSKRIKIATTSKIIAIGSSTGGTEALKDVITEFPRDFPGVVVAQHMPPGFTGSLAQRLDELSRVKVKEAEDGELISVGKVLIAPGNYHLVVKRSGAKYKVFLNQEKRVCFQRPSVDVLFRSVAFEAGQNSIGVILTGMGADGAEGLKLMRKAGAYTIGQDEKTSVVYGMPRKAFENGAVMEQLPLDNISERLVQLVSSQEYRF